MMLSNQLFTLIKLQFKQVKNIAFDKLKEYPILSSLLIFLVIFYYYIFETYVYASIQNIRLNTNIFILFNVSTLAYFMMLNMLGVGGILIYIVGNFLARQTHRKIKLFPLTKYTVTLASVILVTIILNILLLPIIVLVLINISPNVLIFLFAFVLSEIVLNLTFLLIASLLFSLSLTLRRFFKFLNHVEEIIDVMIAFLIIASLRQVRDYMTILDATNFPTIVLVLLLVVGIMVLYQYNQRMSNKTFLVEYRQSKYENIKIKIKNETISNYVLLVIRNLGVYRELFFTYLALSVILILTNQFTIYHDITRNFLILSSVISSGVLHQFYLWFRLNSNRAFKKLLISDGVVVFLVSTLLYCVFLLCVYKYVSFNLLLIYTLALVVVWLVQTLLKLEFNVKGEAVVSFIFFYSFVAYAALMVIERILSLIGSFG